MLPILIRKHLSAGGSSKSPDSSGLLVWTASVNCPVCCRREITAANSEALPKKHTNDSVIASRDHVRKAMSIDTDLQITPKRLGMICMDSFCPRCFWYLLKLRFKTPFGFGGAIWKNLEQAQIAVMNHMIEKNEGLPKEFAPFQNLVSVVDYPRSWRTFRCRHTSGVTIYGEPDSIYGVDDGSIAVLDQKTAHPKEGADPFLPGYVCQVIGYSYIAQFGLKLGTVSAGGLMYWSAQHPNVVANPGAFYKNGRLSVCFVPHPHAIEIDYSVLDAPLKEALRLWDSSCPPDRAENCQDCRKLDALLQVEANAQNERDITDLMLFDFQANEPSRQRRLQRRRFEDRSIRLTAWQEVVESDEDLEFSDNGMVANWE